MAEIHGLEVPKWGMTMEEGTLAQWLVEEGAQVSRGTALAVVESSKISGEIEAPAEGVLRRVLGQAGETFAVGALIGVVAPPEVSEEEIATWLSDHGVGGPAETGPQDAGAMGAAPDAEHDRDSGTVAAPAGSKDTSGREEAGQVASARSGAAPASRGTESGRSSSDKSEELTGPASGEVSIPESLLGTAPQGTGATPHAARLAQEHGIDLARIRPTGRGQRVTVADLQRDVAEAGGRLPFGSDRPRVTELRESRDDAEVPATPIARRLASEHGISLHQVRPTGRAGRVTRADVLGLLARQQIAEAPEAAGAGSDPVPEASSASAARRQGTPVPMTRMRSVIAERLQSSYQQSPHFRVTGRARIDALLALRSQVNEHRYDLKLTVNDLVVRAVAAALIRVPEINATYDSGTQTITQFDHADLSVAVSTAEGLITPILQDADRLSLGELSAELKDLGTRAKAGTLKPEEFQGGTFTVSNLGMFGVAEFDAIINPPQVGILAVAGARTEFLPDAQGLPAAATLLPFTVSADHRVVDGAVAARFIQELTRLLENPALIFA